MSNVAIVGAHYRAPLRHEGVKTREIFVLRPGALGDTILTLPALGALRATFPDAHLTFAGHPNVAPLLGNHYCDATVSVDDPALTPLFYDPETASIGNAFGGADLAVLWLREHEIPARHFRLLGAEVVAAASQPPPGQHATDYLLSTLAQVVGTDHPAVPLVHRVDADQALAADFFREHTLDRPVVAIHPGSGGRWKCWPASRFATLAKILLRRGNDVLLIAGPADAEAVSNMIYELSGLHVPVATGLALKTLAALLARCTILVGNDSGVSHLAAAVGAPVVTIHGPTDPAVWGVRGRRVACVKGASLEEVSVDNVLAHVDALMALE